MHWKNLNQYGKILIAYPEIKKNFDFLSGLESDKKLCGEITYNVKIIS